MDTPQRLPDELAAILVDDNDYVALFTRIEAHAREHGHTEVADLMRSAIEQLARPLITQAGVRRRLSAAEVAFSFYKA